MKFGICTDPANAPLAAAAGFDYIEINLQQGLQPEAGEEAFAAGLERIQNCGLPAPAANCFLPAHLKITGPGVERETLERYVATAVRRAQRAGVGLLVFGSGAARNIPDGFERARAWEQLVAFGRMTATLAADCGVTIAVEPLNQAECNLLNTVAEAADCVRAVGLPAFRLLVDAYHWTRQGEDPASLAAAAGLLAHAHIATFPSRLPPGAEATDFTPFFRSLRAAGYDGRVSVEAAWADLPAQAPAAIGELRRCAGAEEHAHA